MSRPATPWGVEPLCTPDCAAHAAPRVPPGEAVRRCAALSYVLARGLARGERLADPGTLRAEARRVLAALGVRLRTDGGPLTVPGAGAGAGAGTGAGTGTLVVANHISWLDVIALLAVEPVPFLAKREVGAWLVVGTLVRRAGTRFLDRDGLRELPHTVRELAGELRAGRSLLVFPQATTWCGVGGGRFTRATFQAALDAGAPVRPVTVDYAQRGRPSTVAGFLGDEGFGASLWRVAGAGELVARVVAHSPLTGGDRRSLAARAEAAVGGRARGRPPTEPAAGGDGVVTGFVARYV